MRGEEDMDMKEQTYNGRTVDGLAMDWTFDCNRTITCQVEAKEMKTFTFLTELEATAAWAMVLTH